MQRTDKELAEGAMWVHYELQTLIYALRANEQALSRQADSGLPAYEQQLWHTINTCTLESFLVHYRNLKQFLNNLKYDQDVKAQDYSDQWAGTANVIGEVGEDDRLNQLLAHISYTRGQLGRGQWNLLKMEERICEAFERFLRVVRSTHARLFDRCAQELDYRRLRTTPSQVSDSTATMVMWRW